MQDEDPAHPRLARMAEAMSRRLTFGARARPQEERSEAERRDRARPPTARRQALPPTERTRKSSP